MASGVIRLGAVLALWHGGASLPAPMPCPSPDCNGRGSCDPDTNKCFCEAEWYGASCFMSQRVCNRDMCGGHGVCVHAHLTGDLRCNCDPNCGFVGPTCNACPAGTQCLEQCPFVDVPRPPLPPPEAEPMPPIYILGVAASVVFVVVVLVYAGKKVRKYCAERSAGRLAEADAQAQEKQKMTQPPAHAQPGPDPLRSKLKRKTSAKHGPPGSRSRDNFGGTAHRVRFGSISQDHVQGAVVSPDEPRYAGDELEVGPDGKWTRSRSLPDNERLPSDATLSSAAPTHEHPLQQYARQEMTAAPPHDHQYSEPDVDGTPDPDLHLTFRTSHTMESCRSNMYPPYQQSPEHPSGDTSPATPRTPRTPKTPGNGPLPARPQHAHTQSLDSGRAPPRAATPDDDASYEV
eukprot:TRINITY_DN29991_c0_g1_i1.p1 TRINITY_DN29991_c0_g1~~TRINITY_DN29991_c0_g1_i1.p1  ORF type:complete len:403 (+),score=87.88 TRINITY_DN29991_c0_g1_i1:47-1255(+)